jgi:uncharacterized protein
MQILDVLSYPAMRSHLRFAARLFASVRALALAFTLLIGLGIAVRAATADDAKIEQLLAALDAPRNAEAAKQSLEALVSRLIDESIHSNQLSSDQARIVSKIAHEQARPFLKEVTWEQQKPQLVAIYKEVYTDDEIDHILAFYNSPDGRAFRAKQKEINRRKTIAAQQMLSSAEPRIREILTRTIAQVKTPLPVATPELTIEKTLPAKTKEAPTADGPTK